MPAAHEAHKPAGPQPGKEEMKSREINEANEPRVAVAQRATAHAAQRARWSIVRAVLSVTRASIIEHVEAEKCACLLHEVPR